MSCAPVCNTLFWGKQGGKWLASLNAAATTYSYYPSCSWEKLGNIRDQLTPTPSTSSTSQLLNYHLGKPLKIESIQCRGQNNYRLYEVDCLQKCLQQFPLPWKCPAAKTGFFARHVNQLKFWNVLSPKNLFIINYESHDDIGLLS